MAEVLSQNQIDMLLAAMNSGDDTEKTKSKENSPGMRYRKYDFYSPKKFTKDKLRLLQDVFDKYTRIVVSQVNSMFRFGCEIQVSTIEEQRYYEFSNALKDTDILASLDLMLQGERVNKPVLMHITLPIMLDFMDRMMGGRGMIRMSAVITFIQRLNEPFTVTSCLTYQRGWEMPGITM